MVEDGKQKRPVFEGFSSPRYTQVPDAIFDELLPRLTAAELKVLLYIVRRTFGFGKDTDNISLKQLSSGIVTNDGRRLDYGTGLSKSAVTGALLELRRAGIITRIRNTHPELGDLPTSYRVRMAGEPVDIGPEPPNLSKIPEMPGIIEGVHESGQGVSSDMDRGVQAVGQRVSEREDTGVHGVGQRVSTGEDTLVSTGQDTQETVEQKKVNRETDRILDISNDLSAKLDANTVRTDLTQYASDFAREFGDEAPLPSTLTRMVNDFHKSGVELDVFVDTLYVARARTLEWSASIQKASPKSDAFHQRKNRMPYFFAILEEMLGIRAPRTRGSHDSSSGAEADQ